MEGTPKTQGPESPADLKWSQGAKNPRTHNIEDNGTHSCDTEMDIDDGTQISDTNNPNESISRDTTGTQLCETDKGNGATKHQAGGGGGPHRMPPTSQVTVAHQLRFLLVKRNDDENFDTVSPFAISNTLYGLIGETKNVKKTREGLLVEVKSNQQAQRLLQVQQFGSFSVMVTPHGTLNSSKGVVYCPDFLNCTIEEIIDGLKSEGVTEVRRLKTKKNGTLIETPNHVLTFNKPNLPNKIKAAFHVLNVRPYIPKPTRCFNCQAIGHPASRCAKIKICSCGKSHDESTPCDDPKKCVNCGGAHSAAYLNCPKIKEASAIQKIMITDKISYAEAKRQVTIHTPKPNISYAAATSAQPSKPQIDLVHITNHVENIIKTTLMNLLPNYDFRIPTHTIEHRRDRSDSVSTNFSVISEKRKKPEPTTSEDESLGNNSQHKFKKKKGWPKGKPRKEKPPPTKST